MGSVDKALETQLANIQTRAGKSLDELYCLRAREWLGETQPDSHHAQRGVGRGAR
jgi:hypothetical protein